MTFIVDAIEKAHGAGIKVGICGQAPRNYPEFAAFLVAHHIDSISLNPDSFISTVRAVAAAEAGGPAMSSSRLKSEKALEAMDLVEAIRGRRAVRDDTRARIDNERVTPLIDAAIQAPSAMDEQPWSFVVVGDRALLERISVESKRHMLRTTPPGFAPHGFREMLDNSAFDIFYHAPARVAVVGPAANAWATIDCALAAQNMMPAAHAMGLGSCWIGLAQGWLATPEGKEALGLAADRVVIAPLIIGYPATETTHGARRLAQIAWIDG